MGLLESNTALLESDDAVKQASKSVFGLYRKLRFVDAKYDAMVPGSSLTQSVGFNVEKWFAPFVLKWLDALSTQTIQWVTRALENDSFTPVDPEMMEQKHSSSIIDLFAVVYQSLDFISDLQWSNVVQNAKFLQKFAKVFSS